MDKHTDGSWSTNDTEDNNDNQLLKFATSRYDILIQNYKCATTEFHDDRLNPILKYNHYLKLHKHCASENAISV